MADSHKRKEGNKELPMKLAARRNLILQAMASGMSYVSMVGKFSDEWGLSRRTVELAIQDTLKFMRSEETKETLIAMNNGRLDSIIEDSMKTGDRGSAIKAIDTQNKMNGAYQERIKIEGDAEIKLDFGLGNDFTPSNDEKDDSEEE